MKKVLVIYSSPMMELPSGSVSATMTKEFIDEYKKHNDDEIIYLDLNKEKMASTTLTSVNLKSFFNEKDSDHYIEQLKNVDKVVISTSMTNFNYTAVLKNYLDHILVANKTFKYKYDKNGESEGLLKHLKVQILVAQGADFGWYAWGDVAKMLVGTWEFMGTNVATPITLYGTKTPAKIKLSIDEKVKDVLDKIKKAAKAF